MTAGTAARGNNGMSEQYDDPDRTVLTDAMRARI